MNFSAVFSCYFSIERKREHPAAACRLWTDTFHCLRYSLLQHLKVFQTINLALFSYDVSATAEEQAMNNNLTFVSPHERLATF